MKMERRKRRRIVRNSIYAVLLLAIGLQAFLFVRDFRAPAQLPDSESFEVSIQGNIKKPGTYRVAEGTTHFEILQVAGVRSTSDITPFNLTAQIESGQDLTVGELDQPVALKDNVRLEFLLGEISILSKDGRLRPQQEGMSITEGDRVITDEQAQAELSLNTYSRIDMDNFSELSFDKIGENRDGKQFHELFQRTGLCWYKIVYAEKSQVFKVITPLATVTVAGKGANFTIDVKYSEVVVDVTDGLLLIERPKSGEAINLIAGQTVRIYDDGRPFQVSKTQQEISASERFSELTRMKTEAMLKHMPFNFLFCGLPVVFHAVSVQFQKGEVHIIHIPANTAVGEFAQGFSTLQEAFLYGGPSFASSLVERILNTQMPKYMVMEKEDILRLASMLGGVSVTVDPRAASALNIKSGSQMISGEMLMKYLSPGISGSKDNELRQMQVLKAIFGMLESKEVIMTGMLADQIFSSIDANVSPTEIMRHYRNFSSRSNWQLVTHSLPGRQKMQSSRLLHDPILERSRTILTTRK
ncbi:MAG: LCP family protein [Fibrobacterota bacterium]